MKPIAGLLLGSRYRLVRQIAVGGMGEVWVASDQALGREVAVKVLREEYAGNEDFLERLRTEARNSAALSHRNIAQMYDYGEQRGSGYLVMELVHGEPMADLLEREPVIPLPRLLPILSQTARALFAAHEAGVVHRDVKPGNILLDRSGDVKITDFGVSLAANQVPMTATGMVMGTAQYLSPEQAVGQAATGASDVYALGIVAYESVVGHRPFTGSTPVDIAVAHVNEEVPPLPAGVDRQLGKLIMAMLAKDPLERPHPADALADAFDALARRTVADPWAASRSPGAHRAGTEPVQARHGRSGDDDADRPDGAARRAPKEPLASVITPLVIPAAVRRDGGGHARRPDAVDTPDPPDDDRPVAALPWERPTPTRRPDDDAGPRTYPPRREMHGTARTRRPAPVAGAGSRSAGTGSRSAGAKDRGAAAATRGAKGPTDARTRSAPRSTAAPPPAPAPAKAPRDTSAGEPTTTPPSFDPPTRAERRRATSAPPRRPDAPTDRDSSTRRLRGLPRGVTWPLVALLVLLVILLAWTLASRTTHQADAAADIVQVAVPTTGPHDDLPGIVTTQLPTGEEDTPDGGMIAPDAPRADALAASTTPKDE